MVEKRVTQMTRSLKSLVLLLHRSHASLERDLGWKPGTLSRLFSGRTKLTLRHLVLLLRALQIPLGEFSSATFSPSSPRRKKPKPLFDHSSSLWDPWRF